MSFTIDFLYDFNVQSFILWENRNVWQHQLPVQAPKRRPAGI